MSDDRAQSAGARAARNTLVRSIGDVLARVASLVLFALMARLLGQAALGAFITALAFVQIATVPVALGLDRYMLRRLAADRDLIRVMLWNALAVKTALAVPFGLLCVGGAVLFGYDEQTREVAYVLTVGVIVEALTRTITTVFEAYEHGKLLAAVLLIQRTLAAALGIVALVLGFEVFVIAVTYTIAALFAMVVAVILLQRHVGWPAPSVDPGTWTGLLRRSIPFGMQDVFGAILFRVDAVMLSILATTAAVGLYGSAYRLFESSLVFTWALSGSFTPMFVYLTPESSPTILQAFTRALKAGAVVLTPCALVFGLLAEPLSRLFFGDDFAGAAEPLRYLAPIVVLIGGVYLCSNVVVSREGPPVIVRLTAAACVVNIALNAALIPRMGAGGAALAMLITEVVLLALMLRAAVRLVGMPPWHSILTAPCAAGVAMTAVILPLHDLLVPAALAGTLAYTAVLVTVERLVNPDELRLASQALRRRVARASG